MQKLGRFEVIKKRNLCTPASFPSLRSMLYFGVGNLNKIRRKHGGWKKIRQDEGEKGFVGTTISKLEKRIMVQLVELPICFRNLETTTYRFKKRKRERNLFGRGIAGEPKKKGQVPLKTSQPILIGGGGKSLRLGVK